VREPGSDSNYYEVLGVPRTASDVDIKHAFRARALETHPDRGGSHAAMVRVNEAYRVLSDPVGRRVYDRGRGPNASADSRRRSRQRQSEARQEAEFYPQDWEAFLEWAAKALGVTFILAGAAVAAGAEAAAKGGRVVLEDAAKAEYGIEHVFGGVTIPTVSGSWTGVVALVSGAVLGFFFVGIPVFTLASALPIVGGHPFVLLILLGSAAGGAWVGAALHRLLAEGAGTGGPKPP
jgi:hypothetical protein